MAGSDPKPDGKSLRYEPYRITNTAAVVKINVEASDKLPACHEVDATPATAITPIAAISSF